MTARHHHFLPQCYLRGFVRDPKNPRLFVIDAERGTSFSTNPRNVAQERDFHTIQVEGLAPDALEVALSKVESDIAPALERIAALGSMRAGDDRILVLNLATLIAVKNPRHRETMRDFTERLSKEVMRLALQTPERWESQVQQMKAAGYMSFDEPADYARMKDFVERDEYDVRMATGAHLALELGVFNDLLPTFIERRWTVLRAPPTSAGFVTCDHPVSIVWSEAEGKHPLTGPGFGLKGTMVTFPIASGVALMGSFENPSDLEVDLGDEQVADLNAHIIAHADRQVYARDKDFLCRAAGTGAMCRGSDLAEEIGRRRGRARTRRRKH